jgi:hypothetical protein
MIDEARRSASWPQRGQVFRIGAPGQVGGVGAILMLHRVTANPEKPLGVNRHLT